MESDALKSSLKAEHQSLVKLLENKFNAMDMLNLQEGIKVVQDGIYGIQHDVHDMKDLLDQILNGEVLKPKEQQSRQYRLEDLRIRSGETEVRDINAAIGMGGFGLVRKGLYAGNEVVVVTTEKHRSRHCKGSLKNC
jgi:hypothetical protein